MATRANYSIYIKLKKASISLTKNKSNGSTRTRLNLKECWLLGVGRHESLLERSTFKIDIFVVAK
jgi:hypothetical protein